MKNKESSPQQLIAELNELYARIAEMERAQAESRRAERMIALQYAITRLLAESSAISEVIGRVLATICEGLGWDVGELWSVDHKRRSMHFVDSWQSPRLPNSEFVQSSSKMAFKRGEGLPGRVWASGEPEWIIDLSADKNFPRGAFAVKADLRTAFAFPIVLEGEVIGVMNFFAHQHHDPSTDLLDTMRLIGGQIGLYIDRLQAEEALRENELRFRVMAETAADAIFTIDADSNILFANPAASRIFGYRQEELVGSKLTRLMPDYLRQLHEEGVRRYLETGKKHIDWSGTELTGRHKQGYEIPLEVSFGDFVQDGQHFFTGFVRDISARKRAEQAMKASEEHFRLLVENVRDYAIFMLDVEGNVTSWNTGAERILGYSAEEVIGQNFSLFFTPEDVQHGRHRLELEKAEAEGKAEDEGWHTRKNLTRLWASGITMSVRDAAGRLQGFVKVMRDNTERKRADEEHTELLINTQLARAEAEAAQRRLMLIADASAALASSLDYNETLTRIAQLAVPWFADWCAVDILDEKGVLQRLAVAHIDADKIALAKELEARYPVDMNANYGLPQVLRTGKPELVTDIPDTLLVASARDAQHLAILRDLGLKSYIIVPLQARGRTLGAISFVTAESGHPYSQTDLALAEELASRAALAVDNARLFAAERKARDDAEVANRTKDEFLATVSHELRTPLTSMLGWARLLRSGKLDAPSAERALETIERNTKVQAQLIDDLLDVSRIITGKLRLEVQPVELLPVVEAAINAVRPAAEAKSIRITTTLDAARNVVSGDPARLQQIIWNLLSNAIKFTPKDGRVEVRLARINSQVEITVSDTGQGIKEEFLPYVFDRFRQADSSMTRLHGGLGLGLAIVRHLAELHGGHVEARSAGEGRGATFIVRLPLMALHQPGNVTERRQARAGNEPVTAPGVELKGLRVLVVDDEPDTRILLNAVLEQYGAQVKMAASAKEALDLLAVWRPDVLLSDIGMPEIDGYEFIRRVRMRPPHEGGRVPAAALTAFARVEDRMRVLAAGYQIHVPKPVEPAELATVVASLAGRIGS